MISIFLVILLLACSNLLQALVVRLLLQKRLNLKSKPKTKGSDVGPDYLSNLYEASKDLKEFLQKLSYPLTSEERGRLSKELISFTSATMAVLTQRYNAANLLSEQKEYLHALQAGRAPNGQYPFSRDPSRVPVAVIVVADYLQANGAEGSVVYQGYQIELQSNNKIKPCQQVDFTE